MSITLGVFLSVNIKYYEVRASSGGYFVSEIIHLLNHYGYIILFLSLMLELIIIPIPNEALMSYVGVLCFQGKMNFILSIIVAGAGGILGATISYWVGYTLGAPFFRRFGRYIHMGPEKLEKTSRWYRKYGKVLLIVSYFIPGIRHVASIVSGVIKLPYRSFSIFSYIGIMLWVGAFITLGKIFGPEWDRYKVEIEKWLVLASIFLGITLIIYIVVRANRNFIKESFLLLYEATFRKIRSFLKMKLIILFVFALFIGFFTLMVGLIQDLVAHDFSHFNIILKTIIFSMFNAHWAWVIKDIFYVSSWAALGIISMGTLIAIFYNRENRWLELMFFASTLIGAFLFSKGIHWLFQFMLSNHQISSDFPNEQAMLMMAVYGFFFMMAIRHQKDYFFAVLMILLFILVLSAYFLGGIYSYGLKPSDIVAGYVFGAVWLTGMAFSMEMFRLLSLIKENIIGDSD
jgi:membrane protein DedA with SNARE-associated domain